MSVDNLKLIAEFLEKYYDVFQDFLENVKEIEGGEGEFIIDDLRKLTNEGE